MMNALEAMKKKKTRRMRMKTRRTRMRTMRTAMMTMKRRDLGLGRVKAVTKKRKRSPSHPSFPSIRAS